jgi:hypothetical protein
MTLNLIDRAHSNHVVRGASLVQAAISSPNISNRFKDGSPDHSVPSFSAAEMRHIFAIQALDKPGHFKPRPYRYYCIRCKWMFRVNDFRNSIIALDKQGEKLPKAEANRRAATFAAGPCPAFGNFSAQSSRPKTQLSQWGIPRAAFAYLFSFIIAARRYVFTPLSSKSTFLP